jgi:hypothetical protein
MAAKLEETSAANVAARYRLSWVDRLIEGIDRLPGPQWLFYVGCTVLLALLISAILWIDGSVPFGSYGSVQGIFPPFVFYFLALYHYLTRAGSRSLKTFRPLLEADESTLAQAEQRLTRLPRWAGWLSIGLAVVSLPQLFLSGQAFGNNTPNTFLPYIITGAAGAFFGATMLALIIRSIRQLQVVHRLISQANHINLLDLEPAHAFSGLTARSGMGIFLLVILAILRDYSWLNNSFFIFGYLLMCVPAVIVFVIPVLGMRERLAGEKQLQLRQANELLQAAMGKLESKLRSEDYNSLDQLQAGIDTIVGKRDRLVKISTWPWDPGTLRGFASTLLLPILIWFITQLLGRFF